MLGLSIGMLPVASVLHLNSAPWWAWVLLALNGLVWPHIAHALAVRSAHPVRVEMRNLITDSALGGAWIAAMQFNLLPSALLMTMLSVDKVSVGGKRLLARTTSFAVAACLLTWTLLGFPVHIDSPMSVIIACIPFLVAYPLAISTVMYALGQRVARQNRQLVELSRTDDLTGLANRRECLAMATHELERHRRTGRPAVLIVLDIDRFKSINDRYGHPMGDAILRGVTTILRECCRATDTPARHAGDEFMIVMPDTDMRAAEIAAARIRERLAAHVFAGAPDLRCTVSMGGASVHGDMVDIEDWIQQADAALYRAKDAGRNCFVAAPPLAIPSSSLPASNPKVA